MPVSAQHMTRQQRETLDFFDRTAEAWNAKVDERAGERVNVIAQRNAYTLHVVSGRPEMRRALDVGCGVGDLCIELARRGIRTTGLDFAPKMIEIAGRRLAESPVTGLDFHAKDIFEFPLEKEAYDLIVANGFIEYVSFAQRDLFFSLALEALSPDGSLVISSRNRLFNLFSMNSFTEQEMAEGALEGLVLESAAWVQGETVDTMLGHEAAALPKEDIMHADTGVGVKTRYQYTPVQLLQLLGAAGYGAEGVSPIHIHGVLPAFKEAQPAVHVCIANALQKFAIENHVLLPQASAFMVHVRKRA